MTAQKDAAPAIDPADFTALRVPEVGLSSELEPGSAGVDLSGIVVCSFYTDDEYYSGHGAALREKLTRLGVAHELAEVAKEPGQDWADICRRKIGFLAGVCERNPDKKVFWIDVDCFLIEFPEHIANFTADIIGFQRGFGSPLSIGYGNRTRFWEPCFFGINTSANARKFVFDAYEFEQRAEIKATDDYFFEESWRLNAPYLSFQVIPSIASLAKANGAPQGVSAFFSFGASGNVTKFKDSVVQHGRVGGGAGVPWLRRLRRRALRGAKLIERALPGSAARPLRKVADSVGATHVLTAGGSKQGAGGAGSKHRNRITSEMVAASQRGETERVEESFFRLTSSGIASPTEIAAKQVADSFAHYATRSTEGESIGLSWWSRPFPGNFGDWLSPMVIAASTDRSITYQPPTAPSLRPHLVSVGSIGRFIKSSSIVVGSGVSSTDLELNAKASYHSVRGPLTAALLAESGGPVVESFGDPGALIRRIVPIERGDTNGRTALVRHFTHATLPVTLPEGMDELSVLRSHPKAIEEFVTDLAGYDAVVTSAMHVMIVCHSYGIPCTLITFEGFESSVHGTGMKYRDYSLGAGLETVYEPIGVSADLRRLPLASMLTAEVIGEAKLDEIQAAVEAAVGDYLNRTE